MRKLLIAREKLKKESIELNNISKFNDNKNSFEAQKLQDKKYKEWRFADKLIKAMEVIK